jgi:hypothetical protein
MPRDDAKSQMLKAQMGSFKSGKAGGRGRGGKPSGRGGRGGGGGKTAVRERRDTEFLGTLNPFQIGAEYWVSDPKIVWKLTKCTAFEDWKVSVQHPEGHTQTIDLRYEYVWCTPLRPLASTPPRRRRTRALRLLCLPARLALALCLGKSHLRSRANSPMYVPLRATAPQRLLQEEPPLCGRHDFASRDA